MWTVRPPPKEDSVFKAPACPGPPAPELRNQRRGGKQMALRAGRDARSWAKDLLPSPENCSLRRLGDHSASSSSAFPGLASSENNCASAFRSCPLYHSENEKPQEQARGFRLRPRRRRRWEIPRVLAARGASSQKNLFVGPQTPTLHSNSSYLGTETTSRDALERVQLIYTLGSGAGDSPKPQTPHTPPSAPAWVETLAAAARLS